jgi:hypothetical protein
VTGAAGLLLADAHLHLLRTDRAELDKGRTRAALGNYLPHQSIRRGSGYRRISTMSEAIEALAEAWASLDGKLDEFLAGRAGEDTEGDYHGYLSDAAELAKRLEHRGYVIVRAPRDA